MVELQSAAMLLDIQEDHLGAQTRAQRAGRVPRRLCSPTFPEIESLVSKDASRTSGAGLVLGAVEETKVDMYLMKTEYADAQRLLLAGIPQKSSSRPPKRNLALVGTATGAEPEIVNRHLATVRAQCTTFVNWPAGLLHCDMYSVELDLHEGNISAARPMFEKYFSLFSDSGDEDSTLFYSERLADSRPMFELSSQTKLVARVEAKLAALEQVALIPDEHIALDGEI
ncbi:hypothetical protein B0H10DRAFT_1947831 [Mycena sp. CBHHK59/15]|nr:hypothetical protein B0H10DRAFT_1947831 [Mycena sp. CBHHK59/15]